MGKIVENIKVHFNSELKAWDEMVIMANLFNKLSRNTSMGLASIQPHLNYKEIFLEVNCKYISKSQMIQCSFCDYWHVLCQEIFLAAKY